MKTLPCSFVLFVLVLTACATQARSATPPPPTAPQIATAVIPTPKPNIGGTTGPKFVVKPPPMVSIPLPLGTINPSAPSPTPRLFDGFVIAGDTIDSVRDHFSQSGFSVYDLGISFCVFPGQRIVQDIKPGFGVKSVEYSLDGTENEGLVLWVSINDYTQKTSTITIIGYVSEVKPDGSICIAYVDVVKSQPTG